jgi:hypothetical protein
MWFACCYVQAVAVATHDISRVSQQHPELAPFVATASGIDTNFDGQLRNPASSAAATLL